MKKILYFAAVLSAFMTSCTSENEILDRKPVKGTSTITATFDNSTTRVQMGASNGSNTPLQWNAGDKLAVYNVTSHSFGGYQTASSVNDGDGDAVFNYVEADGTSEIISAESHFAAYPYERISVSGLFQYQTIQNYTVGSFDHMAMPMTAKNASGTEFQFRAQAAVLRLKVSTTANDVTVNKIVITSNSKALTGDAQPDMAAGTYGVPTANTGNTVTLNCATPVAINSTANDFNIVVPGQEYSSGDLTITVKTNKGDIVKTSNSVATFVAGKVYNLNISGTPSSTGTAMRTGSINVNWVQLWDNGPKFAEYNVGVTDGKAESYGGYYCWGSNIDKDEDDKYKEGESVLTDTDDTATNLWGSAWRMPTQAELQKLLDNCNVVWTTVNGVNGRKFTGKGDYTHNSVFLPAAGEFISKLRVSGLDNGYVYYYGQGGYYWSSSPSSYNASALRFESGYQSVYDEFGRGRYCSLSVRAVLAE